ncbi:hypothetical protein AAMO2058_000159000 [Amorphochlora amoebiformis]
MPPRRRKRRKRISEFSDEVRQLQAMGFANRQAVYAINRTCGDMFMATEILTNLEGQLTQNSKCSFPPRNSKRPITPIELSRPKITSSSDTKVMTPMQRALVEEEEGPSDDGMSSGYDPPHEASNIGMEARSCEISEKERDGRSWLQLGRFPKMLAAGEGKIWDDAGICVDAKDYEHASDISRSIQTAAIAFITELSEHQASMLQAVGDPNISPASKIERITAERITPTSGKQFLVRWKQSRSIYEPTGWVLEDCVGDCSALDEYRERTNKASDFIGTRIVREYEGYGQYPGMVVGITLSDDGNILYDIHYCDGIGERISRLTLTQSLPTRNHNPERKRSKSKRKSPKTKRKSPKTKMAKPRGIQRKLPKPQWGVELVFSFSLFRVGGKKGYVFYRDSTLEFLWCLSECLPGTKFIAHINEKISDSDIKMLSKAAKNNIKFIRYHVGSKSGGHWAINAMRFSSMWEHSGPECVCVVDIHDKAQVMLKELKRILHLLAIEGKGHALTYWESDEETCVNRTSLPITSKIDTHCHTDGGLCVWMKAIRDSHPVLPGVFQAYCEKVLQGIGKVPKGSDEILLDAFLQLEGLTDSVFLLEHKHAIRDPDGEVTTLCDILNYDSPVSIQIKDVQLKLGGWSPCSMYVCSERQDQCHRKRKIQMEEKKLCDESSPARKSLPVRKSVKMGRRQITPRPRGSSPLNRCARRRL